jgi:hypothetical protein
MRIFGAGPSQSSSSSKKTDKSKGRDGDFAKHMKGAEASDASAEHRPVDAMAAVSGIESLLAAQSVDPDAGGGRARQRLVRRGEDLLNLLDEVRQGLLLGHLPKDRLASLARLVRERREAGGDPSIAAILDEIELRAEVELAKLTPR